MARIAPLEYADCSPEMQAEYDRITAAQGRMTNMKRTLAHNPVALQIYNAWYDLRAQVLPFLGERPTLVFVHAVSAATDCLICSTYFRRHLIDSGESPDALVLDQREQTLVDYGRQLADDANGVSDELFARLREFLAPAEIVTLTAFGGLMVATNLFNNALRVDLDEYLGAYRKPSEAK